MTLKYRMSIDGYGCKNSRSLDGCNQFLTMLVETLKINERQRQLTGYPLAQQAEEVDNLTSGKKKPGISAQIIFLESGLQLHTWPEREEASVDIFSCLKFDKDLMKKAFKLFFKPEKIKVWYRSEW